jgi:molybdopterin-containing oxidoreductase family membrane subunit
VPIALVFAPATASSRGAAGLAAILAVVGGIAQIYVIIIGGQAYPLVLVPGMEAAGSVLDAGIAPYVPSVHEIALGLGGVGLALLLATIAIKVLPILPESLADVPAK